MPKLTSEQLAEIEYLLDPNNPHGYHHVQRQTKNRYFCRQPGCGVRTNCFETPAEAVYEYTTNPMYGYVKKKRTPFPVILEETFDPELVDKLRGFYDPFTKHGLRYIKSAGNRFEVTYKHPSTGLSVSKTCRTFLEAAFWLVENYPVKRVEVVLPDPPLDLEQIAYLKDERTKNGYRYVRRSSTQNPPYNAFFRKADGAYVYTGNFKTPEEALWRLYCKLGGELPLLPADYLGGKASDNPYFESKSAAAIAYNFYREYYALCESIK